MTFLRWQLPISHMTIAHFLSLGQRRSPAVPQENHNRRQQRFVSGLLALLVAIACLIANPSSATAGINDDRFDGNIFALYAGNGALVPPRVPLADSIKNPNKPSLLVLYVDDSSDCKQYSSTVSQLQAFYGKAVDFIPINIDSIPPKDHYEPTEPGYYYEGLVPQTVILNQSGKVVLNAKGNIPFEQVDDVFREVFDLLPRSESVELRRRIVNEFNSELTQTQTKETSR